MSKASVVFVLGSWETNDLIALKQQVVDQYPSKDLAFSFIVVSVGDHSVSAPESSELTSLGWSNDAIAEYLKVHQLVSLPSFVLEEEGRKECHAVQNATLQNSDDQTDHFSEAIEAYNDFNLHKAIQSFHLLLLREPTHEKALFNMASILHMSGWPILAVPYVQTLLTLNADDVTAHSFLWALSSDPSCTLACTDAYRQLAAKGDLRAITKLATLTGTGDAASRGNPSYARQIYDDMAEKFEGKLVDCLGYRGPFDAGRGHLSAHGGHHPGEGRLRPRAGTGPERGPGGGGSGRGAAEHGNSGRHFHLRGSAG